MAYPTSDLYKQAIDKQYRVSNISGELVTSNGVTIPINNSIIDAGSCYVTNQCVNSDAFSYGSVFAAEAGIILKTTIDRYSLYNSKLRIFYNLLLSDGNYETIPLGVFYVNEPNRIGKNISIKAYDAMINFERPIEESTTGTAFELLSYACLKCGVEMAQTQEEISAFVNSEILLSVAVDRVNTFRDLISYIASITCTFAIIDRTGKLRLCEFSSSVNKTIQAKQRTNSTFSDFESFFSSAKANFLAKEDEYSSYLYINEEKPGGLLYDVGDIPIVQGIDDTNQAVLNNIYSKLNGIQYVPSDISFNGDPSLDLGDMIVNIDRFGNQITSLITFYKWTYRNGHQIKSAGLNPKIAEVKEKSDKDMAMINSKINAKSLIMYPFTNSKKFEIQGEPATKKEIVQIAFATGEPTITLFAATVTFELDCDGIVELGLYIDGVLYEKSDIYQYCNKGKNTITLFNYLICSDVRTYKLSVIAKTYYEASEIRENTAITSTNENAIKSTVIAYEILANKLKTSSGLPITDIDDTIVYDIVSPKTDIPIMTINEGKIRAVLFGQGLAGEVAWDGTITFDEEFDIFEIDELILNEFNERVGYTLINPTKSNIEQLFDNISMNELFVQNFESTVSITEEEQT